MPAPRSKVAITDRTLRSLKPAPSGQRLTVWDAVQPNLCVRVTDKGTISFVVVRRRAGSTQPTWTVLGQYPAMSLAQARAETRRALELLLAGEDPRTAKAAQRQAEAVAAEEGTFSAVAEQFIRRYVSTLPSAKRGEMVIRTKLMPVLGERPIGAIRRREVIAVVEDIAARNGVGSARQAHATLSKLFSWALARDIDGLEANPAARCDILPPPQARTRVLNAAELRAIWAAAETLGSPWCEFYRVLMLTGQRRGEIAEARWREIDLDAAMLTIPAERMKAKQQHVVPLTPAVVDMLRGLPRFNAGGYVFTTTGGRRPIGAISQAKERLDQAIGEAVPAWVTHDLRRSMRTGLSTLGVSVFTAELVIGHTQSGVHAVYDLHRYNDEKREALLKWEARLLSIVGPEPAANVIPLRA